MDAKFDHVLWPVLKGTINFSDFFDSIFGLLYRWSKFFEVYNNRRFGLPKGMAHRIVLIMYYEHADYEGSTTNTVEEIEPQKYTGCKNKTALGKYDDVLMPLLEGTPSFGAFFDYVFGFLKRRSDFFHITTDPNLCFGLPKGMAERILLMMYNKYADNEESSF